jgi:hypothetical protein
MSGAMIAIAAARSFTSQFAYRSHYLSPLHRPYTNMPNSNPSFIDIHCSNFTYTPASSSVKLACTFTLRLFTSRTIALACPIKSDLLLMSGVMIALAVPESRTFQLPYPSHYIT